MDAQTWMMVGLGSLIMYAALFAAARWVFHPTRSHSCSARPGLFRISRRRSQK